MTVALEAVEFEQYLINDVVIPHNQSIVHHKVTKRLLCSWLISHVDNQNSSRINSKFQTSTKRTKYTSPTEIWNTLKEFHAKNASHNFFDLQKQLRLLKQGTNLSLREHLDKFENIKSQISQAGGNTDDDILAFTLIESIHPKYSSDVRSITRFVKPLTYAKVFAELLETHKFASMSQQPETLSEEANLVKNNKPRCTKEKCLGPHQPSQCHTCNENAKRAWIEKKIQAGEWKGEIPEWYPLRSGQRMESTKPGQRTESIMTTLSCPKPSKPICFFGKSGTNKNVILFDTGATQHMFNSLDYFEKDKFTDEISGMELKLAGGGVTLPIAGIGRAVIKGENNLPISFENTLYVPELSKNLIAGCILLHDQINICSNGLQVELKNRDTVLLKGQFNNNLMEFTATPNLTN